MHYERLTKEELVELLSKKDAEISNLIEEKSEQKLYITNLEKEIKTEKEQQIHLFKEQLILQGIIDSIEEGILVTDQQGQVLYKNNRFIEIFKLPHNLSEEEYSPNFANYAKDHLMFPEQFIEGICEIIKNGMNTTDMLTFKDGRIVERVFKQLILKEQVFGIMWSFRDITEIKKIEALNKEIALSKQLLEKSKEYNELKTQFFSFVSHELKMPINIILGVIQLLNKTNKEDLRCTMCKTCLKYIAIMQRNGYRLLRLIGNLIDINKIQSGFMKLELSNLDFISTIEEIVSSVIEYASIKNIQLSFNSDVKELFLAYDIEKIERIMLNILSNAIKFTNEGGQVEVIIKAKVDHVLIIVRDTGIGIPEDAISLIFEPFNKVNSRLHKRIEGNGIGLTLVKSFVEMHNGTITCKSQYGVGSEFIIELPRKRIYDSSGYEYNKLIALRSIKENTIVEFSDIRLTKVDKG